MRKQLLFLTVLIATLCVVGFFTWQNRDDLMRPPSDQLATFKHIYKVTGDDAGNVYVISNAKTQLTKMTIEGTEVYQISVPELEDLQAIPNSNQQEDPLSALQHTKRVYLNFGDSVVDSTGHLYALIRVMDVNALLLRQEVVVRYTPDGELDPSFPRYTLAYDIQMHESLRKGSIKSLQVKDDLPLVIREIDNKVLIDKWDAEKQQFTEVNQTELPPKTYLSEITGNQSASMMYQTKRGELYKLVQPAKMPRKPIAGTEFAESIRMDIGQNVYFIDGYGASIKRLNTQTNQLETLLTKEQVRSKLEEYDSKVSDEDIVSIAVNPDLSVVIAADQYLLLLQADGTLEPLDFSQKMVLEHWLLYVLVGSGVVALLWSLKIFYVDIMPRSLLYKQLLIVIPVLIASVSVLAFVTHRDLQQDAREEVMRGLINVAHTGEHLVDLQRLERIRSVQDFMGNDQDELHRKLNFRDNSGKYYGLVYKVVDGDKLYSVVESDHDIRMFQPEGTLSSPDWNSCFRRNSDSGKFESTGGDFKKLFSNSDYPVCTSSDENGEWMFALAPLLDAKEQLVGVYEAGINMNSFDQRIKENQMTAFRQIAIFTGVVMVSILLVSYLQLSSIRRLRNSVVEIAKGNWDVEVQTRSKDEVGDLSRSFNNMARFIQGYITEITQLKDSYFRFVPMQFLEFLGKTSVLEVAAGNQAEHRMSVLVANIRSFDQVTHGMTAEQRFTFLDDFLEQASPIISEHGGVINTFLYRGVLSIFPQDPAQALQSAIAIKRLLETNNRLRLQQGEKVIEVGIALNYGQMMLGVIGTDQRLESSVISDSVNLATALERLSDTFGATMLMPASVLRSIPQSSRYMSRTIGMVDATESGESVEIIDVFEADDEESRRLKGLTKDLFEEAVIMYQQGRFLSAREAFLRVIRENPDDKAAKLYFYLADNCFQNGSPSDWDGTLKW